MTVRTAVVTARRPWFVASGKTSDFQQSIRQNKVFVDLGNRIINWKPFAKSRSLGIALACYVTQDQTSMTAIHDNFATAGASGRLTAFHLFYDLGFTRTWFVNGFFTGWAIPKVTVKVAWMSAHHHLSASSIAFGRFSAAKDWRKNDLLLTSTVKWP